MKKKTHIFIFIFLFTFTACGSLEEEVFTQLGPSNFYQRAEDAEALLIATYEENQGAPDFARNKMLFGEIPTDIMIERRGAIRRFFQPIEDFTWDATHPILRGHWSRLYRAIYRANLVQDKVPAIDMNEDRKQQILAEAKFLRAISYLELYYSFGPTPLIITSEVSVEDRPERATEEAMISFIEDELLAVSEVLPPSQSQFGRATSGAALGFLAKFHLNNKKWNEAAEIAKEVMESNEYFLFEEETRTDLFALENEGNSELIYVRPHIAGPGVGNSYLSHAAPPEYQYKYPPKINYAAQIKVRTEFINTFDSEDERLGAFLFEYTTTDGEQVVLGEDDVRSFKFPEDPAATGSRMGNDFPLLRYADILLARAEALNELEGPNQESIDLINEVREIAGVDLISLSDFSGQESLRDFILEERGREFHTEGLRRQDLIRHGKFIEMAKERGKSAFDYHVLYPIPQSEIDKNSNLVQNEGY